MMTFETYYGQIVSKGNLDNPSRAEAARDLAKTYTFVFVG